MTILTSYTDLLLAETVGLLVPAQRRLLEHMRANLTRTSETLNNLMAVPPTARKKEPDTPYATDVNTSIQEALADARPWLSDKHLNVTLHVADDLPQAAAEPDCVYHMITNLLRNAARATPTGGTIDILAQTNDEDEQSPHLLISVGDQGGGIAPEFLGQIFERFYSEKARPIPGLGGKGAELSMVKRLVEAFGGRVWAETTPGTGCTFSFVLPAIAD